MSMWNTRRLRPKWISRNGAGRTRPPAQKRLCLESLESRALLAAEGGTDFEPGDNNLSGFVYMDTDGDGVRDAGEPGVPGAQVTLSGTNLEGTQITCVLLTTDTGEYVFEDLPSGTYQISERQPTALSDGGDAANVPGATTGNDLVSGIVLSGAQSFTGNNFGESTILPQYVNIVWFFSSSLSVTGLFRETIARAEELAGNTELAAAIREGGTPPDENTPPVAQNDAFTVDADQTLTVTASMGVLANDTDADGDILTAQVVTATTNGTLTLSADGSFTYAPDDGFVGTDTFTYAASDGEGGTDQATATITVSAANNAPVANADMYTVDEDATLAIDAALGLLANDTDAQDDELTAMLADPPEHGTLTLNPDGSFSYVPDEDFSGTDTFRYTASDGEDDSSAAEVTINIAAVDDPPMIVLPAEFSDPDDVAMRLVGQPIDFTVLVVDPDDSDYVFQLDLEESGIPAGAALPTIDPATGQFQWTPNATGQFEIRVIVVNGQFEADQETFLIEIVTG